MRTKLILFYFIWLSWSCIKAQTLSGTVADSNTHHPLPYVSISLLDTAGKSILGTTTDGKGRFVLKPAKSGAFVLHCSLVGYQLLTRNVTFTADETDLGSLIMIPALHQLNEVTVLARQPELLFQPDKKIFEVGKDVLSQNGSVSDALNGIPSVAVSPQGQVSLRGNTDVTILVNGKRSGLAQGNVLDQLQADQIERIEVITNPSARYDASGRAGIINIVLKKNKRSGLNGQLKVVAGVPNDTRINPSLNYKSDKLNLFSTFGMRKSDYKGIYTTDQVIGTNSLAMKQDEKRHDDGKMLYLGADYLISDKHTMTAAYLWNGTHDHDKTLLSYDYSSTRPDSTLRRNGESWEQRNYNQLEYNYTQLFSRARQKWTIDLQYDWWDSNKDWALGTQKIYPISFSYPNISTNTRNANRDLLVQSDWVQPVGKETLLELGIKTENRNVAYDFLARQQVNDDYVIYRGLDNGLDYSEHIQSAYVQMGGKQGSLSYLAGLRLEATGIRASGRDGQYQSHKNYLRLFPTAHLDYSLSPVSTLQIHYSRRISRPSLYQLSPFMELTDFNAQNIGNPDLDPTYSDLWELGFLYRSNTLTINPSVYVQASRDPVTDYTFRNADNIFITLPVNLTNETRQGIELNVLYNPIMALQLNASFNLYHFRQSGSYIDFNFDFSGSSSSGRLGAQWKLSKTLNAQGRYYYSGSSATAQTRIRAMHWADFGVSKTLLSDRLSVVGDVTNIFDSRRYRTTTTGTDYIFSSMSRFNGARYRLSIVYKFKGNGVVREAKAGNRN